MCDSLTARRNKSLQICAAEGASIERRALGLGHRSNDKATVMLSRTSHRGIIMATPSVEPGVGGAGYADKPKVCMHGLAPKAQVLTSLLPSVR